MASASNARAVRQSRAGRVPRSRRDYLVARDLPTAVLHPVAERAARGLDHPVAFAARRVFGNLIKGVGEVLLHVHEVFANLAQRDRGPVKTRKLS